MRRMIFLTSVLSMAIIANISCNLGHADCNPRDFMMNEIKDVRQSGETELAFVLVATEEEFNRAKQQGGIGVYGLFSGSYSEAKEKARRLAQTIKFDYREAYASSYFSQTLSPKALDAYLECLNRNKETPGLRVWLAKPREGDFLTFNAFWVGVDPNSLAADFDKQPFSHGGSIVSQPTAWRRGKTEEIVVMRSGNNDVFLNLKVGGQVKSYIVVKDPPTVTWDTKPVVSERLIEARSYGPNPGCSAGIAKDCIVPLRPGGTFVEKTAAMTEFTSSGPSAYSEKYEINTPQQICVIITQSTGACETVHVARGV